MTSIPSSPSIRVPFLELHPNARDDENSPPSSTLPLVPRSDFEDAYVPFQALHIRGSAPSRSTSTISPPKCGTEVFTASDVQQLFESLNDQDKDSWCIENESNRSQHDQKKKVETPPHDFLDVDNKKHKGYCSFLVQHSKIVMKNLLSSHLPMVHLPVAIGLEAAEDDNAMDVNYGPCLWLFFGKNYIDGGGGSPSSSTLQGRPEHTDSVTHDGTWHYQLSGTKIWRLRPTTELIEKIKEHKGQKIQEQLHSGAKRKFGAADGECNNDKAKASINCDDVDKRYIEVECKQGDFLLLNTRLWWHSTLIPPQDVPCISYARDVYFSDSGKTSDSCNEGEEDSDERQRKKQNQIDQQQSSMTNIDGTYAAEDIDADTVLFTEHNMPDCELHRSKTNPNCQVVELEDEKTGESYMAVVSMRCINAGEFFCIIESDDEEEEYSAEEEEDWEEDE